MKRISIAIGITLLMLTLLGSAFAFSLTLQDLHVNAFSFAQPAEAAVTGAPMTSDDEAAISAPSSESVHLADFAPQHVCNRDKTQGNSTDF
jgi:hypothetical protein